MSPGDYLPHLSDPVRRHIAERYIKHELIKLFPNLRDHGAWHAIESDIARWFEGNPTLAPVRDFWNGAHSISMGVKLKDLVPMLTSDHIQWAEENIPTEHVWFTSRLDELANIGPHLSASAARRWYYAPENREALGEVRRAHDIRSAQTMQRDDFPVIVKRSDAKNYVHDGNRRVLRAVLFDVPAIPAVVGRVLAPPEIHEQWVPTSMLLSLVELCRARGADYDSFEAIARVIGHLVRDSSAGQFELVSRCLHEDIEVDALLANRVAELLRA